MRIGTSRQGWLAAALVAFQMTSGRAGAMPLDPSQFQALGAFPASAGTYTIDTSGTPTLTGPGSTSLTGVVSNGVAVFTFSGIDVASGTTIIAEGSRPVALLSEGNVMVSSSATIDLNGQGAVAGAGGGPGGYGGLGGGIGGGGTGIGGGGGFGGAGGGIAGTTGLPYGDLSLSLQGGSGGGAGAGGSPGGGGAGGLEIGARGSITVAGSLLANGGGGSFGGGGGGGGSGGGLLLHGDSVTVTGLLSAQGGAAGGGGGGGGRVLVMSGPGGFLDSGRIDVDGGSGLAGSGLKGQVAIATTAVPEPSSLLLTAPGLLGLGFLRRPRRVNDAR